VIIESKQPPNGEVSLRRRVAELAEADKRQRDFSVLIDADSFWAVVRRAIVKDPHLAAEKTGLPLDRLDELKPPRPSILLSDLWAVYVARRAKLSKQTRSDNKRFWETFCRLTRAHRIAEITADAIGLYHRRIHEERHGRAVTMRHFAVIKRVFKHGLTKGMEVDRLVVIIELLNPLRFEPYSEVDGNGTKLVALGM
jgi:hypothetical protein